MNKNGFFQRALLCAALVVPITCAAQDIQQIDLKQAVNTALKNSREVALAQVRYNVAEKTVSTNRSAFQPNLYTGSGAAYSYGFPMTVSGQAPSIVNLSYVQTVFNPLQTAQTRAAEERREVQRLELERTRNTVALQTSSAYLELGKVRHSLELMRNQRQSNTRILSFTRQRQGEGLELPIEVTRAELEAARTEQRIVQLESRESTLQQQLSLLLGIPAGSRIVPTTESIPTDDTRRERDLIDRAFENSLELRQGDYEKRAREHLLAGQIGSKWPSIDIVGEYGLFGKFNNFDDYFLRFQRNNFTVGIQARIPLISSQRSANIALARSELSVSEMELRLKRQNLELDVSRQYQKVRELEAAREVGRLELKLAQENLQVIQANFQEGRANLRDVERARLDENDKWVAFLDNDYERQRAELDLLNLTGDLNRVFQ
jgi:outer membrane protein TolC